MKKVLLASLAFVAMIIVGCGGGAEKLSAPEIVKVVMDTASVTITWKPDTTVANSADFKGYNVYALTDSSALLVEDGEDLSKINTDAIEDTFYTVTGLSKDSIWYIQVRTVNTDDKVGTYNTDVPFVAASPRPEFIKTVYLEWFNGDTTNCAIHFSTGEVKKRVDISTTWGDMWIDHDTYGSVDSVWFQSAYKADTTAGYRDTKLKNEGQFGFDDKWQAPATITLRVEPIKQGDLVFAKTKEGNYVKVHVDSLYLNTTGSYGWAKVTYAYQNVVNFPYLIGRR